jgi:dihydroorotase
MPLSATAAVLETAAQNGDRMTIDGRHNGFVRSLRELAASVKTVLDEIGEKMSSAIIAPEAKDWLHGKLAELKLSIAEKRMQHVDAIMDGFSSRHWPKDVRGRLKMIMQHITLFEWQEAVEQIDQLQQDVDRW